MNHRISLPLREFLTIADCPGDWQTYDLYLFRDEETVFYVGQSQCAFNRVWSHLRDGFKGRSLVGRFILMNWPAALQFTIELISSQFEQFDAVENHVLAAEQMLIAQHSPCFNAMLNQSPTVLPAHYNPPTAHVRRPRTLRRMIYDAEHANRWAARQQLWS